VWKLYHNWQHHFWWLVVCVYIYIYIYIVTYWCFLMLNILWLDDKFYILWLCTNDRSVNANKLIWFGSLDMSLVVRILPESEVCLPRCRTETCLLKVVAECEYVFQFHQEVWWQCHLHVSAECCIMLAGHQSACHCRWVVHTRKQLSRQQVMWKC
jgi:hypothetical protein